MPPSAGIGTIVHEAMEKVPDGDLAKMTAIVDEHWPELDFETDWVGRKERRRADLYVERLRSYLHEVAADGGRVVGAEAKFRFAVDLDGGQVVVDDVIPDAAAPDASPDSLPPRAVVSGIIDRVEVYPAGGGEHGPARGQKWQQMIDSGGERVVVVDLKTGKYEPDTEANVREHAQLAAYQVAVQQGLLEGAPADALAGARLVIVSKTVGKANYRVAHQHTLDDDARTAFLQRVAEAGRGMSASSFTAQVQAHCADTQVRVTPCHIHTVPAVSA